MPVSLGGVDAWAKTLGGMRQFWYTEVAGPERLAEIELTNDNEGLVDLIEWMGYLLEDLMESREACLRVGASLDPADFLEAD